MNLHPSRLAEGTQLLGVFLFMNQHQKTEGVEVSHHYAPFQFQDEQNKFLVGYKLNCEVASANHPQPIAT